MSAAAAAAAATVEVKSTDNMPISEDVIYVRPMRGARSADDPAFSGPSEKVVNVCSTATPPLNTTLSPFYLGPVDLPFSFVLGDPEGRESAKNMENAWQYTKVYKHHTNPDTGEPTAEWYAWARAGFRNLRAVRFPMGRGAKPEYSFGGYNDDGTVIRLGYVEARFRIYAPLYARLVDARPAGYDILVQRAIQYGTITLLDFDGWNHRRRGLTLRQVMYNPKHKCGHGFVLAMMLTNQRVWNEPFGGDEAIAEAVAAEVNPAKRKAATPREIGSVTSANETPTEDSGAAGPPPKASRVPQPPPVNSGVPVPPAFQAWAQQHGYTMATELSRSRAAFGEAKYKQPLMTQDGRDSVEDALDEAGDFNHYMQKAIMNGEDVSKLGPHIRAMLRLYMSSFSGQADPPATLAAHALVSESSSDIDTINAEVLDMQEFIRCLQDEARKIYAKQGYIHATHYGTSMSSSQRKCYNCGSESAHSIEMRDAPVALGYGQKLVRFACLRCKE